MADKEEAVFYSNRAACECPIADAAFTSKPVRAAADSHNTTNDPL